MTSLHLAAQNGHLEMVKLLLDQGAEIDAAGNGDLKHRDGKS